MKTIDAVLSIAIGELAALLMLAIGRNIILPDAVRQFMPWLPLVFPLFTLIAMAAGSLLGRYFHTAYQLAKFALVGGLNFLIDLGILNLLIFAAGISSGFYAAVFKALAFLAAMTSSFIWNKFWTFGSFEASRAGKQFVEFFIVSGIGLLVNVGSFAILNDALGAQAPVVRALTGQAGIDPKTWASVSAAGAAMAGLFWNFIGYKFIVFRRTGA